MLVSAGRSATPFSAASIADWMVLFIVSLSETRQHEAARQMPRFGRGTALGRDEGTGQVRPRELDGERKARTTRPGQGSSGVLSPSSQDSVPDASIWMDFFSPVSIPHFCSSRVGRRGLTRAANCNTCPAG